MPLLAATGSQSWELMGPGTGMAAMPISAGAQLGQCCGCAGMCPPGWSPQLMPCRSTKVPVVLLTLPIVEDRRCPTARHFWRWLRDTCSAGFTGLSTHGARALWVPLLLVDVLSRDRGGPFTSGHRDRPLLGGGCQISAVPLVPVGSTCLVVGAHPCSTAGTWERLPFLSLARANAGAVPQPKPRASLRQVCHPACHCAAGPCH